GCRGGGRRGGVVLWGEGPHPLFLPRLRFMLASPGRAAFCFHGGSIGHAVQPAGQRLALVNGSCVLSQDPKSFLKNVFGVLFITPHPPAYPPHPPPPPPHPTP